jgi:hypothetical protein
MATAASSHPFVQPAIFSSPLPISAASALQFVHDAECMVFDDGQALYGYSDSCAKLWKIHHPAPLYGWTIAAADLYVQFGAVLCHYDLNALRSGGPPTPDNAHNLDNDHQWPGPRPLSELFAPSETVHVYAAPVSVIAEGRVLVLALRADGTISALHAELTRRPSDVFSSNLTPTPPAAVFPVRIGDELFAEYVGSDNKVVALETHRYGERRFTMGPTIDPAGGAAHWRRVGQAAALQGLVLTTGAGQPLYASFYRETGAVQAYASGSTAAVLTGPAAGAVFRLGATDDPHTVLSTPVVLLRSSGNLLFAVTSGAGGIALEQYLVPAATPLAADVWALAAPQFAGISLWQSSGATAGAVPFDDNGTAVARYAVEQMLGIADPALSAALPAAAKAATRPTIVLAAPLDLVDPAVTTLHGYGAVSYDELLDALAHVLHPAGRAVKLLKSFYAPVGVTLAAGLLAKGYADTAIGPAMHDNGYLAIDFLRGVAPGCEDYNYWRAGFDPQAQAMIVTPAGAHLAGCLHDAGYTPHEVASACQSMTAPPAYRCFICAAILKSGYPDETPPDAVVAMLQAGMLKEQSVTSVIATYGVRETFALAEQLSHL